MIKKLTTIGVLALLAGCNQASAPEPAASTSSAAAGTSHDASIYMDAVQRADRTEADRARDEGRQPAKVLEFFGIRPGMKVLDLYSGGGYYTELLSRVVGPEGQVVAHSNNAYAQFVGDEATIRYANGRLANVEILMAENNELQLPADSFDAIMMVLAYHDIYYVAPNNGWAKIDGPTLRAELYEGLRPGGVLAIVDHYAAAGSPRDTGNTLHRIDPQIVIDELQAAGFKLEAKSDVLRNMDDDHGLSMAAPEVRGKTDRFVLKFSKPN